MRNNKPEKPHMPIAILGQTLFETHRSSYGMNHPAVLTGREAYMRLVGV